MSQNESDSETMTWLTFAIEDLKTAKLILLATSDWSVPRNICYLCQQSVKKALKAIYVSENQRFHKIHDLDSLKNNLPDSWKKFGNDLHDLSLLTDWAVEGRYPGDWTPPSKEDASAAYTQAKEIIRTIVKKFISNGLSFQEKILETL